MKEIIINELLECIVPIAMMIGFLVLEIRGNKYEFRK